MTARDLLMTSAGMVVPAARWLARAYGALLVGLVVVLTVGEGMDPSAFRTWGAAFRLVTFGLAVLGLAVAWRWELTGGLMTVGGLLAFGLSGLFEQGRWGWRGWAFWSILVVGVAFTACGLWGRRSS